MLEKGFNQYVRSIRCEKKSKEQVNYPFNLEAVRALSEIELHPNVTFLVGENGSGKSTLLEAVAVAYGFNPEGGSKNFNFHTKETHSRLADDLKLSKGVIQPKDGFFLRAESFYNVASNIADLDQGGGGPPIIGSYGGVSLHKQSHGESFMALLLHRFGGNGLYILDEPEAALSPTRQLALLRRIHELVEADSQFIIATHSPILMSYPHAKILLVEDGYREVPYEETEHVQVMKDFMACPERTLRYILHD
jgi:predicted ATPase